MDLNSHCSLHSGGGFTASRHFVVINVSESVSKAFLKSSVAYNGGLAHVEHHGPSFISLTDRRNRSIGVWLQASHTDRHILYSCGMQSWVFNCVFVHQHLELED